MPSIPAPPPAPLPPVDPASATADVQAQPRPFPRHARLLTPAAFQRVFGKGRRLGGRCFTLHVLEAPGATCARLGLAVSRKVERRAVARNRIKRQAREAFRTGLPDLPALDLVLVARREAAQQPAAQLRRELESLLARAATLKPTAPAGTMPAAAPTGAPPPSIA